MADIFIRNQRKHLLSIIPIVLKMLPILKVRIIFVKYLQYVIEPVYREPLPATESLQR